MNSIKKLKENIAGFLTEIAAHYGIPKSEVVATLREINFYSLYQTLCWEAMPVFTFRACGDKEGQQPFSGEKLFPCCAINLYRVSDYGTENDHLANVHFMEVWLREDLTLAITSCFHVDNKQERYRTSYRVHKGGTWPFEEDEFVFSVFVEGLLDAAPGVTHGQPLFEP